MAETTASTPGRDPRGVPDGPSAWSRARIEAFRRGDRPALEAIYREELPGLMAFLRGGFRFDAQGRSLRFAGYRSSFELHDAVQEAFRRAFEPRARQDFDGLRPFGPWLRVIARNVVLKEFRRRERLFLDEGRVAELAQGVAATSAEDAAHRERVDPELALHRERVRASVRRFVASLDAEAQRLVALRFVEGLGQREAAAALGIGRQRLRTRESRIRERLIRHLAREDAGRGTPASANPAAWLAWIGPGLASGSQLLRRTLRRGVGHRPGSDRRWAAWLADAWLADAWLDLQGQNTTGAFAAARQDHLAAAHPHGGSAR